MFFDERKRETIRTEGGRDRREYSHELKIFTSPIYLSTVKRHSS
jgi:hypothetical protein